MYKWMELVCLFESSNLSDIVSTSFHVCLWSVVLKSWVVQDIMSVRPLLHQGSCATFSHWATLSHWNLLVSCIWQKNFYMHLFQTLNDGPVYACLEKKNRSNHIFVLLTTGILGYKFLISAFPSPTCLLPQTRSDPLPFPSDASHWNSTFFLFSSFLWPLLPPYKGKNLFLAYFLSPPNWTWRCAYSKFLLKLQEWAGTPNASECQIKKMFLMSSWIIFNRPGLFGLFLYCTSKIWKGH